MNNVLAVDSIRACYSESVVIGIYLKIYLDNAVVLQCCRWNIAALRHSGLMLIKSNKTDKVQVKFRRDRPRPRE